MDRGAEQVRYIAQYILLTPIGIIFIGTQPLTESSDGYTPSNIFLKYCFQTNYLDQDLFLTK